MTPSPVGAAWRVLKRGWRWYHRYYNRQYVTASLATALTIWSQP